MKTIRIISEILRLVYFIGLMCMGAVLVIDRDVHGAIYVALATIILEITKEKK